MLKFWNRRRQCDAVIEQKTAVPLGAQLQLKNVLQPKQHVLWTELFSITLGWIYQHYGQISGDETHQTLFERCLNEVCKHLNTLNQQLAQEGLWETQANRNRVATVFVFYRTVWQCLLKYTTNTEGTTNGLIHEQCLLLRRIPPKVTLLLGADYWRLYELYQALFSPVEHWVINADLRSVIQKIGPIEQNNSISCAETSFVLPTTVSDLQSLQEKQEQNVLQPQVNRQQFKTWLQQHIEGLDAPYAINAGDSVFAQKLQYPDSLFITEKVLQNYLTETAVAHTELSLEQLIRQLSDGVIYHVMFNGQSMPAIRIDGIEAPIYKAHTVFITATGEKAC